MSSQTGIESSRLWLRSSCSRKRREYSSLGSAAMRLWLRSSDVSEPE